MINLFEVFDSFELHRLKMLAKDCQGSLASFNFIGRSIPSRRQERIYPTDAIGIHGIELNNAFQKKVAKQFANLSAAGNDDMLSIAWIRKLLRVFLRCLEEFQEIVAKSLGDRLMDEFLERSVKALDVCNAIREGIEKIREWQKLMEIVLCALGNDHRILGEGQFRRAKKVLIDLGTELLDEKNSSTARQAHRNRSFGSNNASPKGQHHRRIGHFRSLSWSVSQSWSAAKQLHAIGNNLTAPGTNEIVATNGLAVAFFTMNSVLLFVMWALVAAIPCQDRGLHVHFSIPQQFVWAEPMLSLHKRILELSKKKERRNAWGLLKEVHEIETQIRFMNELVKSVQFPLTKEKEREARQRVLELGMIYEAVKEGLDPLESQVREVFRKIVCVRAAGA